MGNQPAIERVPVDPASLCGQRRCAGPATWQPASGRRGHPPRGYVTPNHGPVAAGRSATDTREPPFCLTAGGGLFVVLSPAATALTGPSPTSSAASPQSTGHGLW